jgi:hypothetical protein
MPRAWQEMPRLVKFSHLNNRNLADYGLATRAKPEGPRARRPETPVRDATGGPQLVAEDDRAGRRPFQLAQQAAAGHRKGVGVPQGT